MLVNSIKGDASEAIKNLFSPYAYSQWTAQFGTTISSGFLTCRKLQNWITPLQLGQSNLNGFYQA